MAYTTIDDPSVYFHTQLYTGTGSSNAITNDGNSDLQPDWIWLKDRSATNGHAVQDTSRGITNVLFTNGTDYENQYTNTVVDSVQSDGFTVSTNANSNTNTNNYVAWQWKCNGGTTTSFTESGNNPGGTIQTNTTAGFSIITTTGTGATGTIAHGLGAVPHWWLSKQRSNAENWAVYHVNNTSAPETEILSLNTTDATADNANAYNDTAPTSTNLTVHTKNEVNTDGRTYVHYVFIPIQGYSKFGSYEGNGSSSDGPFVYTGFKPAWLMYRNVDRSENWLIEDIKRNPYNRVAGAKLQANVTDAETNETRWGFDFLSNGFKVRQTEAQNANNGNGETIIYMAFAEHPFVSSKGVPTTAR